MPEAPSPKDALEIGRLYADLHYYEAVRIKAFSQAKQCEEDIRKIDAALATLQPSGDRREAIARIIDPEAFENWERAEGNWRKDKARTACWPALEKAGVILASGLVQDEAGIRDKRTFQPIGYTEIGKMIDAGIKAVDLYNIANTDILRRSDIRDFLEAALSIRSARDGGAET